MSTTTELADWLNGTANGGPNGDGRYPLTGSDGTVVLVYCPAAQALNPPADPEPVEVFADSASAAAADAATSKIAAAASAADAYQSALTATAKAATATSAATTASTKAGEASTSASAASAAQSAAESAQAAAGVAAADADASADAAADSADSAQQALTDIQSSVSGITRYKGVWDASGNTLPANPAQGDFYKIQVGGQPAGMDLSPNDQIFYNGTQWDAIDNTDQVTTVFGRKGAVVLTVADVPSLPASIIGSGTLAAARSWALTGVVTSAAGSSVTAIADNALSIAKTNGLRGELDGKQTAGDNTSIGSSGYIYDAGSGTLGVRAGVSPNFAYFNFKQDGSFNVLNGGITAASVSVGGNAVWHAGNFNPATKADSTNPTLTGNVNITNALDVGPVTGSRVHLETGGTANAGWIGFFNTANVRTGYIGNSDANVLMIMPEGGRSLQVGSGATFAGNISLPNGSSISVPGGGKLSTGPQGGTWTVQQGVAAGNAFSIADYTGAVQWSWDNALNLATTKTATFGIVNADSYGGAGVSAAASNNTLVKRNPSGYVYANYFNMTANDVGATQQSYVAVGGVDGFLRWQTSANFLGGLRGLSAPGSIAQDYPVAQYLRWKNFGNSHVIIDASAGTSPTGSAIDNLNSASRWSQSYGNLMGWNGSQTYGVKVDRAFQAETLLAGSVVDAARIFSGWDSGVAGAISCSQWFRATGQTGLYCADYGGGWYMTDSSYMRSYQNKPVVASDFVISSDETLKTAMRALPYRGRTAPIIYVRKATGTTEMGFGAQTMQKNYPEVVSKDPSLGTLQIHYPRVTAIIAAQANRLEDLQEKQAALLQQQANEIAELRAAVTTLTQLVQNRN